MRKSFDEQQPTSPCELYKLAIRLGVSFWTAVIALGDSVILKEGQSAVEVMRAVHRGIAIDGPVQILVFYAGAAGIPTTLAPAAGKEQGLCH